jgi:protein SCO1/2
MKRFGRFIILAVIGFGLGGGLAYFQGMGDADAPAASDTAAVSAPADPVTPDAAAATAEMANAAEMAMNAAAADVAEAVVPAAAATETAVQAIAGSMVGGAFTLTDHNGNTVTEASWPGKHKLVFFGFTNCPDICPAALDKITSALNALGPEAGQLQPLFFTTDPARDTAEQMKMYLGGYHPSILGLTGTEEQVKVAKDAYKVYAAKVPGVTDTDYMIDHSAYVYLMSPDDKMVEIFGKEETADVIADKIRPHLMAAAAAPAAADPAVAPAVAPAMPEGAVIPGTTEGSLPNPSTVVEGVVNDATQAIDTVESAVEGVVPAVPSMPELPQMPVTPTAPEMPAPESTPSP